MEKAKKLIFSLIIIFMATPLYADKVLEQPIPIYADMALKPIPIINHTECMSFCDCINTVKKDTKDDADTLRAEWKEALGVDIFFLHFKAKEITNKIEEKSKFKLFNMCGKATIKENSVSYAFNHKF